jgi:flagellar motor switch protein FliM
MEATLSKDTAAQSDVERLLAEVNAAQSLSSDPGSPASAGGAGAPPRHEFPQWSFLSPVELRKLRLRQEQFIVSLGAALSIRLGTEVTVQMPKLETASFQKFLDSVTNPAHLVILNFEPLSGSCVLDVPLRLALALVDRELGGPGVWNEEPRELTKMESAMLSKLIDSILSEWCAVWRDLMELRPVQIGVENTGSFLDICAPATISMILGFEIRFGQIAETIQFVLPYPVVEPLVSRLHSPADRTKKPSASRPVSQPAWNRLLDDVQMKVTAELPAVALTASQLADLKPGDMIPIPAELMQQVRLFLEGSAMFNGVLGTQNNQWAIRISAANRG